MAFRKRNIAVGRGANDLPNAPAETQSGIRPSSLTSTHTVTSTGTPTLDAILGGHNGLALGSSLLVEESGTTDFAGALLKYYAAEGICHRHVLHVVGVGEGWVRELPDVAEERAGQGRIGKADGGGEGKKMKIAWRYERLGGAGERALPDRSLPVQSPSAQPEVPFCHTFDLTKRLPIPQDAQVNHIAIASTSRPFDDILQKLQQSLSAYSPNTIHRLVVPTLLSPALYPPQSSRPDNILRFLHALRALLRQHSTRLTAMITLPLELYPRTTALIRWAEILSDGVLELTPFPHLMDAGNQTSDTSKEEQPQGLVRVHKIPINTERGEGGAGVGNSIGEDLAFTVSRRKFVIKPFSLPPMEGDQEAQGCGGGGGLTGKDVEF